MEVIEKELEELEVNIYLHSGIHYNNVVNKAKLGV